MTLIAAYVIGLKDGMIRSEAKNPYQVSLTEIDHSIAKKCKCTRWLYGRQSSHGHQHIVDARSIW